MDTAVARNIKGYELRERIGTGGFGVVYRAHQTTVGREIAIKIILPGLANQPDFIRRFEAEAQLVARLEHPHITPLYDYWRDPDGAYLVMRWLRGGSLRDALQNGPFELRAAALLLDQIAGALSLAHRNSVIHRDIKPGNILLDEDGNAYLTDFGIAKDLNLAGGNNTHPEAIVGSLDYISPEQARSEPITPRTDIYSLGITLFEVITGHHPFENMSSVERLYKHINDPLPEITTLEPRVNDAVNRVIQKATAKNPEHRYPDALAFAADFREAVGMNRAPTSVVELLTQREQEILALIIEGLSNKEIAQRLTVTLSTVKWYVNQIYDKMGVRSRVQAMVRARELNLLTRPGEATSVMPIPTEDFYPENPYKGLRAFQSADNQDFFGREKETARLVKRLGEAGEHGRFLAVVGPSGSGKSSLVKAGLIPALWRGELPGSEKWFVVEMLPGSHPLDELEIALTKVAANQAPNMREHLERDARGLLRVANLILPNDGSELVLVIDQFEEVFTLVEDEAERSHFLSLLYTAVTEPRSRVRVIVTLRADFYDRPLHYPTFGELVRTRLETVMPLSAEELERAITQPAQRVGVTFEPGLVATIVADVNYQPGALPLLQYALTELFECRQGRLLTREAYQAIGGTVGALAKRADELYLSLNENGQEITRQMFLRLVTLGESSEDTRRRTPRSELLAIAADAEAMDEIIDTYASYRLLSLDTDPGTRSPTVEVAHEALLREWERLRAWLNDSRDEIKTQRQLAAMATEWHEANRDVSFLAHGSRLEQFEKWAAETQLALTPHERQYLETSLAEREHQTQAEQERQMREKALERRSIRFLRMLVAVLLLAVVGAFGLTGFAVNQSQIAQRNAAETQNIALIAGSQAALATGHSDQAIALAMQAVTLDPSSAGAQLALSDATYAPGTVRRFDLDTGTVWDVALSPDGHLALSGGEVTPILLDVATGRVIQRLDEDGEGHTAPVEDVAFSPDGQTALSASDDGTIILWDIAAGQFIRRFEGHTGEVYGVAFSPDGRTALSASNDTTLILWDVETGEEIRRLRGHTYLVEAVTFSSDGHTALSASWDGTLILWDLQTGDVVRRFQAGSMVRSVAFGPNDRTVISGGERGIVLWNVATGEVIQRFFGGHTGDTTWVEFSPDGLSVLSGSPDATLILWDVKTGEATRRFGASGYLGTHAPFTSDGRYIVVGSGDGSVRLLDLQPGQISRRLATLTSPDVVFSGVAISPDGRSAITRGNAGATLWDMQTGEDLRQLSGASFNFNPRYSPDGRTILIPSGDPFSSIPGYMSLWDVETGQEINRFRGHTSGVVSEAFSSDGRLAASCAGDGVIILWDVETREEIRRFVVPGSLVNDVAFSSDDHWIVSGYFDGSVIRWDVNTGESLRFREKHAGLVNNFVFSPDGLTVLSSGWDGIVIVWDVATGEVVRRLTGHTAAAFTVSLSTDGRLAFAGSADNTGILWDVSTGDILRRFVGGPWGSAFTHDGQHILVNNKGRIELWRIDTTDELLSWTRTNRYIPELTCEQRELYRLEPLCAETAEA